MAEETFQPQLPPPNAPKYFHPGFYYYSPEPFETTHIPKSHHHVPPPLKHAQRAVHDLIHPFGDGYPLPVPHCDIRETPSAYHLDVELPGLRDRNDVRLKWTGARSLFVDASIRRPTLPEEEEAVDTSRHSAEQVETPKSEDGKEENKHNPKQESKEKVEKKQHKTVHLLRHERKIGEFARGFNFPVDVDQDKTVAKLAYGVLTIVVPKKEKDQEKHKDVEIEHAGH